MNLTDEFIGYIINKSSRQIPQQVIGQAKKCLLDYLGAAAAGAYEMHGTMDEYLSRASDGGKCSMIGTGKKAGAVSAAFVNGFHAHVMELDDGHRFGMIHLAAPIISAVLAAAENENASGDILLRAIIMGYEAAVRLALSIQPQHKRAGYHTSGTCGTIGAAMGVGIILGLDKAQLKAALSAAAASAAGLLEIQEDGSELKPYNTGNAAMSGLNAAYTGLLGHQGPDDILGGSRGFVNVLAEGADPEKMLGDKPYYEIERVYFKPYAACRHCHSAIEAAMSLRRSTGLSPGDIDKIKIKTYKLAVKGHDHQNIQGIPSAKLSIPFCTAAAYILQECGADTFVDETVNDKHILELAGKVIVEEDEDFSALSPERRIAELEVISVSGEISRFRVDYAKGDPENPMTDAEALQKFAGLMKYAGEDNKTESIAAAVKAVETEAAALYRLLS